MLLLNNVMSETWFLLLVCVSCWFIPGLCSEDFTKCESVPLGMCELKISTELIPENYEDLDEVCRIFKKYRTCLKEKKFKKKDLCGWPLVLHKVEPLIKELCYENTPLRQKYLDVAPCIKTTMNDYEKECHLHMFFAYTDFKKHSINPFSETGDRCVKKIMMGPCYRKFILENCGKKADDVYKEFMMRSLFYNLICFSPKEHRFYLSKDPNYLDQFDQPENLKFLESLANFAEKKALNGTLIGGHDEL